MPGLDRTGPQGQGSRTGRQMGRCTRRNNEQDKNSDVENLTGKEKVQGRGLGRVTGRGMGRGSGRGSGRNRRNWE